MSKRELIKNTPFFSELNSQAVSSLEKIIRQANYNKNDILFFAGEPAKYLFFVESGLVELIKSSPDGKEQLIRTVNFGETFAEAAMFAGEDYPVTAIVRSKSSIMSISKENFLEFVRSNPEVSLSIMGAMSKLLRHLNTLVTNLSLTSVASRLAQFLLQRSRETGSRSFELGIKKRELAFKLGTISETLSRNFKKMRATGIINVTNNTINIIDITALRDLAE